MTQPQILWTNEDILEQAAWANPVNLVGVMGRGLARTAALRWPGCVEPYRKAIADGSLRVGTVTTWARPDGGWIIQAPTKVHWRRPSEISVVAATIDALAPACRRAGIERLSVPPLGCGLGGLARKDVLTLIEAAARAATDIEWVLHRWK